MLSESLLDERDQLFEIIAEILQPTVVRVACEGDFDLLRLDLVGFDALFVNIPRGRGVDMAMTRERAVRPEMDWGESVVNGNRG